MTKARVGGGFAIYENESSKTITWPGGLSADHIAVITVSWFELSAGTEDFNTPSGFTQRDANNVVIDTFTGRESRVEVWTKSLTGSESGSLTVSFNLPVYATVVLDVFSGDGDLTYNSMGTPNIAAASTDAVAPSASGTSGQLLVCCFGLTDPPGTTNAVPSGTTIGASATETTNYARNYWKELSSTGSTTDLTWDFTSTRDSAAFQLLIDDAGGGGVTGTLAKTLGNDTLAASGTPVLTGSLNRTLGSDTLAAAGTTTVSGTLAKTLGNDTLVASGSVGSPVSGTLALTLANDTLVASGTSVVSGSLAKTLGADTLVAAGTTSVLGTLSKTLGNDTLVASGSSGSEPIGALISTLRNDTLVAVGSPTLVGSFASTLTDASLASSGTTTIAGTLASTLRNDLLSGSGYPGTPTTSSFWRFIGLVMSRIGF